MSWDCAARIQKQCRFVTKYYSRLTQRALVPEAVLWFTLFDPNAVREAATRLDFPVFVKPIKSFFSILAEEVKNVEQLEGLARQSLRLAGPVS